MRKEKEVKDLETLGQLVKLFDGNQNIIVYLTFTDCTSPIYKGKIKDLGEDFYRYVVLNLYEESKNLELTGVIEIYTMLPKTVDEFVMPTMIHVGCQSTEYSLLRYLEEIEENLFEDYEFMLQSDGEESLDREKLRLIYETKIKLIRDIQNDIKSKDYIHIGSDL